MLTEAAWHGCMYVLLCAQWGHYGPAICIPSFSTLELFSERRGQSGFSQVKALDIDGPQMLLKPPPAQPLKNAL